MSELTRILNAAARGETDAAKLLPLVYDELRQLAARKMARESGSQTLQATALVHEAWLSPSCCFISNSGNSARQFPSLKSRPGMNRI